MSTVTSKDCTTIAYDRVGSGPALILVDPAMGVRQGVAQLAALLSEGLTVYTYNRRGRGDSGDTPPYAVEREIEDIEAMIDVAGGKAYLFGQSSGSMLALRAATQLGDKVTKLAMFEAPFIIDTSRPPLPADYVEHLEELTAAERRGDAVMYFMTDAVGIPAEYLGGMRESPMWSGMEAVAHTISYDGRIMGDTMSGSVEPLRQWATLETPTLTLDGTNSPPSLRDPARVFAEMLPNGQNRSLEGVDHSAPMMSPQTLAPVLLEFYLS